MIGEEKHIYRIKLIARNTQLVSGKEYQVLFQAQLDVKQKERLILKFFSIVELLVNF